MQAPNTTMQNGGGMQSMQQPSKGGGGRGFGNTTMSISPTHHNKGSGGTTKSSNAGCYDMPVNTSMSMSMPFSQGSAMPPMPTTPVMPDMGKMANYLHNVDSAESKLILYAIEMGARAASPH